MYLSIYCGVLYLMSCKSVLNIGKVLECNHFCSFSLELHVNWVISHRYLVRVSGCMSCSGLMHSDFRFHKNCRTLFNVLIIHIGENMLHKKARLEHSLHDKTAPLDWAKVFTETRVSSNRFKSMKAWSPLNI